ncbi:MAG TPA: FAD-binding oxidoreductase [Solirubrobacteraceae bacterium]
MDAGGVAAALHDAERAGRRVRVRGAGTRPWGRPAPADDELSTAPLDAIVEHNEGDLTAIVQAGVALHRAQEVFAQAGQMLALDPPGSGTIGGLVATGDSGPLRHRYHAVRDLVLGVQVAMPDGTVARAGSKVIKNVAGYDLAKLLCGSFGTLGVITEVSLRLHPRPPATATAVQRFDDPHALASAASSLAHRPIEAEALDVAWEDGEGSLLARFAGGAPAERAGEAVPGGEVVDDDEPLWERQRAGQRSADGTVVRVSTTQRGLGAALAAAPRAVGRAALGLVWITLPDGDPGAVRELRERLAPAPCVVLDAPDSVREALDPWGEVGTGELELMRRVKARFDPFGTCNPGVFAGGI